MSKTDSSSRIHSVLSLSSSGLSLLITITLLRLLLNWSSIDFTQPFDLFSGNPKAVKKSSFLGDDVPEFAPIYPGNAIMQVQETVHLGSHSNFSDHEWLALIDTIKLPIVHDDEKHVVLLPMFHQLHCTETLRSYFLDPKMDLEHFEHCANYIRQWILCQADTTLEPGDFTERDYSIERTGEIHVCRDWQHVFDSAHQSWKDWVSFWLANGLKNFRGKTYLRNPPHNDL